MKSRDPTRSAGLRRQGRAVANRRVFELHRALRQALQDNDVLGLRRPDVTHAFMAFVEAPEQRLTRGGSMVRQITDFMIGSEWLYDVVERSVRKGMRQAGQELRVMVGELDAAEVAGFHAGISQIEAAGISNETQRRIFRHMIDAMQKAETPEILMSRVRDVLEKITRARLMLLINTSVVRSVNAGKLFAYRENGVRQVGVEAEWLPSTRVRDHVHDRTPPAEVSRMSSRTQQRRERVERMLEATFAGGVEILTAGDDKVCEDCQDISNDGPYDIDMARSLIPAHPNCRCAFVPYGDERFAPIEED